MSSKPDILKEFSGIYNPYDEDGRYFYQTLSEAAVGCSQEGDLINLKRLLTEYNVDVNVRSTFPWIERERTILEHAIQGNQLHIIEYLFEEHGDILKISDSSVS
jgi:hypothetical protein